MAPKDTGRGAKRRRGSTNRPAKRIRFTEHPLAAHLRQSDTSPFNGQAHSGVSHGYSSLTWIAVDPSSDQPWESRPLLTARPSLTWIEVDPSAAQQGWSRPSARTASSAASSQRSSALGSAQTSKIRKEKHRPGRMSRPDSDNLTLGSPSLSNPLNASNGAQASVALDSTQGSTSASRAFTIPSDYRIISEPPTNQVMTASSAPPSPSTSNRGSQHTSATAGSTLVNAMNSDDHAGVDIPHPFPDDKPIPFGGFLRPDGQGYYYPPEFHGLPFQPPASASPSSAHPPQHSDSTQQNSQQDSRRRRLPQQEPRRPGFPSPR